MWDCWGPRQWLTDNHRVVHPDSVELSPYIEESRAVLFSSHPAGLRIPDHGNMLFINRDLLMLFINQVLYVLLFSDILDYSLYVVV